MDLFPFGLWSSVKGGIAGTILMVTSGTILIADDDDNDVLFLKLAFGVAGISNPVQVLHDGVETIRYLTGEGEYLDRKKYPVPQLMLLDLKMPMRNGFEVLDWRRKHRLLADFPVIVISGSSQGDDIRRAMELGATEYLVKPANYEQLIMIARNIRSRWLEPFKAAAFREV